MSKDNDRKKLEAVTGRRNGMTRKAMDELQLLSPGQVQAQLRPPQDPFEAQIEELHRIIKKAQAGLQAQGVTNAGPPFPRGFVGGFSIEVVE